MPLSKLNIYINIQSSSSFYMNQNFDLLIARFPSAFLLIFTVQDLFNIKSV